MGLISHSLTNLSFFKHGTTKNKKQVTSKTKVFTKSGKDINKDINRPTYTGAHIRVTDWSQHHGAGPKQKDMPILQQKAHGENWKQTVRSALVTLRTVLCAKSGNQSELLLGNGNYRNALSKKDTQKGTLPTNPSRESSSAPIKLFSAAWGFLLSNL